MTTSFELTLDDTSPVINYYPFAETLGAPNLLAGWNSYFSESGFLSQLGETGLGDSLHVTSLDGAVLTIQWFGTGISLFGSVVDAAYQVSLDGDTPSIGLPRQDVLVEFQGLQPKQHLVALIAHPSAASNTTSHLAFDRAALNVSTDFTGASVSSEAVDVTSPRWIFSGDWEELSDPGLVSLSNQSYRVSSTRSNTASIEFTGTAITVTGIRNVTHGHYNVTLDGITATFDGHSDWLETSTLFLQAGLDETAHHSLTIANADDANLVISGINVTHVSGGTPISDRPGPGLGLSAGTLIGVVFAIILGVLAVVTAIACIYFRRNRQRRRRPTFTSGGISSANFTTRIPRNSEYVLQDLYTAPPHTASEVDQTEEGRRGDSILLATNRMEELLDPSSPTPYLRSSKNSSTSNSLGRGKRERSQSERTMAGGVENVVRELFAAHVHPDSGIIDSSEPLAPTSRPVNSHSRRRSTITDTLPPRRPRVEIPQSTIVSGPLTGTPTSQRMLGGPLLLQSPVRRSRRGTFRSSVGAETPSKDASLPSVSTIKFERPWDERRESGATDIPGTTTATVKMRAPRPQPGQHDASLDILERLRGPMTQRDVTLPGRSDWKPPW